MKQFQYLRLADSKAGCGHSGKRSNPLNSSPGHQPWFDPDETRIVTAPDKLGGH